MILNLLF